MGCSYTHGREFVAQIRPILASGDVPAVMRFLEQHWPCPALLELLDCGHDEAVAVALFGLSLVGGMEDNAAVALRLDDDDAGVAELAEHALWSIWFRAGSEQANLCLLRAVHLIDEGRLEQGLKLLDRIIAVHGDFAEAYNQRAIARFLAGHYRDAIADCQAVLRMNPYHFGALAGMGHCHASVGELERALAAYHQALAVHPRLQGIRQSIRQIRACMASPPAPDGSESPTS